MQPVKTRSSFRAPLGIAARNGAVARAGATPCAAARAFPVDFPLMLWTASLVLFVAAMPLAAQTTSADGPAVDSAQGLSVTTDAEFLKLATSGNVLEIRSSELALERASSQAVRGFAERMIADHRAASERLAQIAGAAAPDLSQDLSGLLVPHHAGQMAQIEQTEGAAFDDAYLLLQRQAHEEAIALFQTYATNGEEGAVKAFAEETVPKLQEHFQAVQDVQL